MKKFVSSLVAGLLVTSFVTTALARSNVTAGQGCDHLKGMAKQNCARGSMMKKKEMKYEKQTVKKFLKRHIKEMERDRQRTEGEKGKVPITICHKGDDGNAKTMTIPTAAWSGHAEHGDMKGECQAPVSTSSAASSASSQS